MIDGEDLIWRKKQKRCNSVLAMFAKGMNPLVTPRLVPEKPRILVPHLVYRRTNSVNTDRFQACLSHPPTPKKKRKMNNLVR